MGYDWVCVSREVRSEGHAETNHRERRETRGSRTRCWVAWCERINFPEPVGSNRIFLWRTFYPKAHWQTNCLFIQFTFASRSSFLSHFCASSFFKPWGVYRSYSNSNFSPQTTLPHTPTSPLVSQLFRSNSTHNQCTKNMHFPCSF